MTQQIRLSQFITTYGPGGILEGAEGPRLIPRPDIGLFNQNPDLFPDQFEISHLRMSKGLLGGARIFRLPSNAELGYADNYPLYRTIAFPSWNLCVNTSEHPGRSSVLYRYRGDPCPVCNTRGGGRADALRFVLACSNGHMDDVNWRAVVHRGTSCDHHDWFYWSGGGGALRDVRIVCRACKSAANLGQAYGQAWNCRGRHPENESTGPKGTDCNAGAMIIQRQATYLRIAELRTLFTIPPRATKLHRLIARPSIRNALDLLRRTSASVSEENYHYALDMLVENGELSRSVADELKQEHSWANIHKVLGDLDENISNNFEGLLQEEFEALLHSSQEGHPPVKGPSTSSPVLFEINPSQVREVHNRQTGLQFQITPVSRLSSVTVQTGYRREIPTRDGNRGVTGSQFVPVYFTDEHGKDWYPGAELYGEGIFITLAESEEEDFALAGPSTDKWRRAQAYADQYDYPEFVFRSSGEASGIELHPEFVWWHTLSHLIIRSLSVDSGYAATSIRERVYIKRTNGGRLKGGIILYATQPGSDGTLGGLIGLVPSFDRILHRALHMAKNCSNDPLCDHSRFQPAQYAGAACYGCLFASETSCEHRNLWLDRHVILENLQ